MRPTAYRGVTPESPRAPVNQYSGRSNVVMGWGWQGLNVRPSGGAEDSILSNGPGKAREDEGVRWPKVQSFVTGSGQVGLLEYVGYIPIKASVRTHRGGKPMPKFFLTIVALVAAGLVVVAVGAAGSFRGIGPSLSKAVPNAVTWSDLNSATRSFAEPVHGLVSGPIHLFVEASGVGFCRQTRRMSRP